MQNGDITTTAEWPVYNKQYDKKGCLKRTAFLF